MKNKLQYVYSISVFIGVLVSSYLMIQREGGARLPFEFTQSSTAVQEAAVFDPAVNSLFEIEQALMQQNDQENDDERAPSKSKADSSN